MWHVACGSQQLLIFFISFSQPLSCLNATCSSCCARTFMHQLLFSINVVVVVVVVVVCVRECIVCVCGIVYCVCVSGFMRLHGYIYI